MENKMIQEIVSPPHNHIFEVNQKLKNIDQTIHNLTKSNVGLDKVDNTADADKSVKYATTAGTANSVTWQNVNGKPSSMPANDVASWAKAASKPTYTKAEIGLSNVDNTSDLDKPISTATQRALDVKVSYNEVNSQINEYFLSFPLKLKKIEDHKYELYVDADKDQLLQLKNYPGSSIWGIPINVTPIALRHTDSIYFSGYYQSGALLIFQQIDIDYSIPEDLALSFNINVYHPDLSVYINISKSDYLLSEKDVINVSESYLNIFISQLLKYYNIDDTEATITNINVLDATAEGTYIIKTGNTLHTISNLDTYIIFPENKIPTFEVNKTYFLKVTYDYAKNMCYCTDIKSFSNI